MRYFTQPKYDVEGTTAKVAFVTQLVARDERGRAKAPYINQVDLTLRKVDGRWALTAREQGPMT